MPKTLYVGDDNGTHSIFCGNGNSGGATWDSSASIQIPNTTVYCPNPGQNNSCEFFSTVETFFYRYKLVLACGNPGFWRLYCLFGAAPCSDIGGQYMWSQCLSGFSDYNGLNDTIPFDSCDFEFLTFNLRTTIFPTNGATTPGGGGEITVSR
jgi:hypothetical protein